MPSFAILKTLSVVPSLGLLITLSLLAKVRYPSLAALHSHLRPPAAGDSRLKYALPELEIWMSVNGSVVPIPTLSEESIVIASAFELSSMPVDLKLVSVPTDVRLVAVVIAD